VIEWGLPPALYLPIAAGIAILSAIFGRSSNTGLGNIMKRLRQNFVSYRQIDEAAKQILSSFGVPAPFKSWVAGLVAQVISSIPDNQSIPTNQVVDIVASKYSDLSVKKAKALLPISDEMAKLSFARKRIAQEVIQHGNLI
jgi:hypothetical protein